MNKGSSTLLEGLCWFLIGLAVIFAIGRYAWNYR